MLRAAGLICEQWVMCIRVIFEWGLPHVWRQPFRLCRMARLTEGEKIGTLENKWPCTCSIYPKFSIAQLQTQNDESNSQANDTRPTFPIRKRHWKPLILRVIWFVSCISACVQLVRISASSIIRSTLGALESTYHMVLPPIEAGHL